MPLYNEELQFYEKIYYNFMYILHIQFTIIFTGKIKLENQQFIHFKEHIPNQPSFLFHRCLCFCCTRQYFNEKNAMFLFSWIIELLLSVFIITFYIFSLSSFIIHTTLYTILFFLPIILITLIILCINSWNIKIEYDFSYIKTIIYVTLFNIIFITIDLAIIYFIWYIKLFI